MKPAERDELLIRIDEKVKVIVDKVSFHSRIITIMCVVILLLNLDRIPQILDFAVKQVFAGQ